MTRIYVVLLSVLFSLAISGCYGVHVARGQLQMVNKAIPLSEALESDELSAEQKDKIKYIQEIKKFAEEELFLKSTNNYQSYLPKRHYRTVWFVNAAHRDRLKLVSWQAPIVGSYEYRMYFSQKLAEQERNRWDARGYDAHSRSAAAYSTGGWFPDPITPNMLQMSHAYLAQLIIHELTHATIICNHERSYTESAAEFVSYAGAEIFLETKFGSDSPEMAEHRDSKYINDSFDAFMNGIATEARALYAGRPADLDAAREKFFAAAKSSYDQWCADNKRNEKCPSRIPKFNNAIIISFITYGNLAPFQQAFLDLHGNWPTFIDATVQATKAKKPFAELRKITASKK